MGIHTLQTEQQSSLHSSMLQPEVTRIKTKAKLFPTKNDKENKTNISLTINGKKDENIKILPQKRTKVTFYIDNCLFEKNSKFLSSKSCSLVVSRTGHTIYCVEMKFWNQEES